MRVFLIVVSAAVLAAPLTGTATASAQSGRGRAEARVTMTRVEGLAHGSVNVSALSNRGEIVGCMFTGVATAPLRWTPQRGVDFFLGHTTGCAEDVNNAGAIVGWLETADETFSGFRWTARQGLLLLDSFIPSAINSRGQIAGACVDASAATQPCLWEDGVVTVLSVEVVGFQGVASDINDAGQVTGQVRAGDTASAFVWWRRTGLVLLPSSTGDPAAITGGAAIDNRGQVVGFEALSGTRTPAHWTRSGDVSTLPLDVGSAADINSGGVSVGRYSVFVGDRNEWVGYISIPQAGVFSLGFGIPVAINDRGDILGLVRIDDVNVDVVIWRVRGGSR